MASVMIPALQLPSPRFRCPKCAAPPFVCAFKVTYEGADPDLTVGERLRVECRTCGYVGYEDCADAPPAAGKPVLPPFVVVYNGVRLSSAWPHALAVAAVVAIIVVGALVFR